MKKINSDKSTEWQIDDLDLKALSGRLSRRSFIARLIQLGVSLSAAGAMATRTASAWSGRDALRDEYDYIIVGAGSAGCVMADRISATGASVLLIEAGTDQVDQPTIVDSYRWVENFGSDLDWNRSILPQMPLNDRQLYAAAGKVLGGSGSINGMLWFRGDMRDALRWQQLVGPGWKPSKLYKAFLRVENFLPGGSPYRGSTGVISVGRYASDNPITAASIAGAKKLGLPPVDHNASAFIDGAGVADVNILPNGRRSGPAQTYLVRALKRDNFTVLSDVLVTGLNLNGSSCRGVNAVVDGQARHFAASREVVLSGGAFGSPRLLMLSGIGPEDVLRAAGVTVRHRLSYVGRNLHDHMILPGIRFYAGPELSPSETYGRVASHSFFRTNSIDAAPNIQVMCMQGFFPPNPLTAGEGFNIMPWLAKVESRGSLALTSADPRVSLAIDPGYLREDVDRETLLAGLDYAISLGLTEAMAPFSIGLRSPASPFMTREEKLAFITANASPGVHYVGTCSAGRDPNYSVVNQDFRVWGIDGLRVVDASVIPEVPGVNPQGLILALAELAAETMGYAPTDHPQQSVGIDESTVT
ncbi:MAG: hypothetical protein B7X93_12730 [Hydrogenophilales bacterium 17-61-9]|nr:MAG: hypothetical protein B7X93_12730 [Hydrogenophilales bacterium 17-61-9]